jgi:hypothetical protein
MEFIKVYIDKSMSTEKQRKTPVRWSDEDINAVWAVLPDTMKAHPMRGLTWQVEEAGRVALGERWRRIPSFAVIPSSLLKRIADQFPSLKNDYPQLEAIVQLPLNKETFINLVVEARLTKPFEDFVDIWNECVPLVPELGLAEVSHSKYLDPEMTALIHKNCEAWLTPPVLPEPEPQNPPLDGYPSVELLMAYHKALVKELTGAPAPENKKNPPIILDGLDYEVEYLKNNPPSAQPAPTRPIFTRPQARKATAQQVLGSFHDLPAIVDPPDTSGRMKIRVTVVDHNVSKTPADFERTYENNSRFKFNFIFMQIGATGTPDFKQGGYAIISESAPVSWKKQAIQTCGHTNVHVTNGSRDSISRAMDTILVTLNARFPATNGQVVIGK